MQLLHTSFVALLVLYAFSGLSLKITRVGNAGTTKKPVLLFIPRLLESGRHTSLVSLHSLDHQFDLHRLDINEMQTEVTLAQILVRVEEQLSGRPITLVGEGTGAILSLYLAAAGTLLIDAMALLDPIIELSALEKILSRGSITDKAFSWRNQRWLENGKRIVLLRQHIIKCPIFIGINTKRSIATVNCLEDKLSNAPLEIKDFRRQERLSDDIASLFEETRLFKTQKEIPSLDVSYPTHADLLQVETSLDGFVKGFSPVFMHMTKDGKVKQGIEGVPTGSKRPVLLVANHQLYGLDIGLILREFLLKKHTLIRGLAHPAVFESGLSTDGIKNLFLKYGAVPVSPHNAHELLSRNETVLLFPGGANEAYHGKAEENKLIWNSKSDFVRMAAIFNATIIPVAAIGLSSSFRMLLDANELKALPLIGRNLKRFNGRIMNAKPGVEDNFIPPLIVPILPRRNYFLFGKPIETGMLNIYNKAECQQLYLDVRRNLENNIAYLLEYRKGDPYDYFPKRIIYETLSGHQAPSAPTYIVSDIHSY